MNKEERERIAQAIDSTNEFIKSEARIIISTDANMLNVSTDLDNVDLLTAPYMLAESLAGCIKRVEEFTSGSIKADDLLEILCDLMKKEMKGE